MVSYTAILSLNSIKLQLFVVIESPPFTLPAQEDILESTCIIFKLMELKELIKAQ